MSLSLSVALCTYNGERYVAEQFDSILSGEVLPTEIVVADDGSTDGTLVRVRDALARAESLGITVQLLPDRLGLGVTANFERAIAATTGEVVVLSDQDDVWHPSRLADVATAFSADPRLLFQHNNARLVDENGEPLGLTLFEALEVTASDLEQINSDHGFDVYLHRNLATGATVAFRRRLFDIAAPLPPEWIHDEWLAIVGSVVGTVRVTDTPVIDYRQHGSNQIGVAAPTLRYRMQRMLATSPGRNATLARRAVVLSTWLDAAADNVAPGGIPVTIPAQTREAARAKTHFEQQRAALPPARLARLAGILRINRGNSYALYASQGRLDMLRDLLQAHAR
jgi:glycosyltransferase involved in cell wall biosynthesis